MEEILDHIMYKFYDDSFCEDNKISSSVRVLTKNKYEVKGPEYTCISELQRSSDMLTAYVVANIVFSDLRKLEVKSYSSEVFIKNNIVIKVSDASTPLEIEIYIGMYYINKLCDILPNFARTYGFVLAGENETINGIIPIGWITPTYDMHPYAIIEYIPGDNLTTLLKTYTNTNGIAQIILQVVLSMKIAYEKYNIVHGDLHASNVMIMKNNKYSHITYEYYDDNIRLISDVTAVIIDYGYTTIMGDDSLILDLSTFIEDMICKVNNKNMKKVMKDMEDDLEDVVDRVLSGESRESDIPYYIDTIINIMSKYVDKNDIEYISSSPVNEVRSNVINYNIPSTSTDSLQQIFLLNSLDEYTDDQLKIIIDNELEVLDDYEMSLSDNSRICLFQLYRLLITKKLFNRLHRKNPIIPYMNTMNEIDRIYKLSPKLDIDLNTYYDDALND
jgi:tRNA A-37 threonylcarbamoyl transferase component Bud32